MERCAGVGDRRPLAPSAVVSRGGERRARVRCPACRREFYVRFARNERGWPIATVPVHKEA